MKAAKNKTENSKVSGVRLAEMYSNYGIFFILLIVFLISLILIPNFGTIDNLLSVINQNAITVVLACGMTMLIISANIDLSAGVVLIVSNVVCAWFIQNTSNVPLACLAAIFTAIACEAVNGLAISYLGLNGFIVTLATQLVYKGLSLLICNGTPIYGTPGITFLAQSKLFGIPLLIVFMLICVLFVHFILSQTSFGRYLYAIGGNNLTAQASGINAKRIVFCNFLFMGFFAGIAGVLYTARANSGQPSSADITFDAIIATVLGGTSMSGGSGVIAGAFAGALVVGIINNILNLGGVSPYYQNIVKGIIIFLAILIDKKTRDAIMRS